MDSNNIEDDMSSKIADLNKMQLLSDNIQKELDNGKQQDFMDQDGLESLQSLQLKQLKEIQKMQELQLKNNEENTESESESEQIIKKVKKSKGKKKKNTSKNGFDSDGMIKLLQDPLMVLALYVLVSHPTILNIAGTYIPNLVQSEGNDLSITNLILRGIMLVSIYFGLKMFVF
jgi:hypothetical protein